MTASDYYTHKRAAATRAPANTTRRSTIMSMFAAPSAPSGGITWADHKDALLLIEPLSFEAGMSTAFGTSDAVRANVHVIDGPGAGESYEDTLIFPKILASQTKNQIGQKVLGRLGQGQAKAGQSAPWLLNEATPEDIAKAEAWVKTNQAPTVTSAQAPF